MSKEQAARKKRVRIRQEGGDDGYSWVIRIDGVARYTGMDRREAEWRRTRFIEEGTL